MPTLAAWISIFAWASVGHHIIHMATAPYSSRLLLVPSLLLTSASILSHRAPLTRLPLHTKQSEEVGTWDLRGRSTHTADCTSSKTKVSG